jgi:hypothetical protein
MIRTFIVHFLHLRDPGKYVPKPSICFIIPVFVCHSYLRLTVCVVLECMSRLSTIGDVRKHIMQSKLLGEDILEDMFRVGGSPVI